MNVCEKYNATFTFYFVANSAIINREFVKEIIERGHEIGCHGYNHLRFDQMAQEDIIIDLKKAISVFEKMFAYQLSGFRAPYLAMNDKIAECLIKLGFVYSSSTAKILPFKYENLLHEWPITVCDWYTLIRNNQPPSKLYEEMIENAKDTSVFELHPWRCGQKKYIWILEEFLKQNKLPCVSNSVLNKSRKGIALTGDIGELSLYEVFLRSAFKYGTRYKE